MDSSFFQSPPNEKSFDTKGMQTDDADENILVIYPPMKSGVIVLMDHPASFTVYKYVSVQVLSGTVSINGYELTKRSHPVDVFSSEKTGLIAIKTEDFDRIWKKQEDSAILKEELQNITDSHELSERILYKFGNSTVALFIKRLPLPYNVAFAEYYFPSAFSFDLFPKKAMREQYYVPRSKGVPLQFGLDEEKLATEISSSIRKAKLTDIDNPKILVYGPRRTGKSTLLRYLLNKILSIYPRAFYLDTDPGQPEFTPPGVVSLTQVKKPILGPPFCHQKVSKMMFVGSTTACYTEVYTRSISRLANYYTRNFAEDPLFVNTMGWIDGVGLEYLKSIIDVVKPTVLIEIAREDETAMFDYREYFPQGSQYFQIYSKHQRKPYFSPKEMRELTLLSHLGRSQSPFLGVSSLNEISPHCVPWDKIALFVYPGGNILPSRMVEALNQSIVALCDVCESYILKSDTPEFPKTVLPEAIGECLGYGIVTAVNEKDRQLYIVTSLKTQQLARVNALFKGNITVPNVLILKQEICNQIIPFTNVKPKKIAQSEDVQDTSMVSLKNLSENDSPDEGMDTSSKGFAPVKNFRRKIPTRHRRPIKKW